MAQFFIFMSRTCCGILLFHCVLFGEQSMAQMGHVDVDVVGTTKDLTYIRGYSANFGFELTSSSENGFSLRMDSIGLPSGLSIQLLDPDGNKLESKIYPDEPSATMGHLVKFKKGDSVRLSIDLNERFAIKMSGRHTLEFLFNGKKKCEETVLISSLKNSMKLETNKQYYGIRIDKGRRLSGSYPINCEICVGQLDATEESSWYLALRTSDPDATNSNTDKSLESKNQVLVDLIGAGYISTATKLEDKFEVMRAIVDYKCKLWVLLKRGDENSIFIWDIKSNELEQPFDWGSTIRLESTKVSSASRAQIVFARRDGKVTISSLSIDE